MKILALKSSGLVASVAVWEDGKIISEFTTNFKKTHSQTLLPMLDEVVGTIELELESVDAIAISAGPGSFTGLRIGSATAKGLGLALNKPLISVPTVDALAYNFYGTDRLICPMMDARRQQVYTGLYTFENGDFKIVLPQRACGVSEITEEINQAGKPVIFLGDGVPVYEEMLKDLVKVPYTKAPAHLAYQRAGALASLAALYFEVGKTETAREAHRPDYLKVYPSGKRLMGEKIRSISRRRRCTMEIRRMAEHDVEQVALLEREIFSRCMVGRGVL